MTAGPTISQRWAARPPRAGGKPRRRLRRRVRWLLWALCLFFVYRFCLWAAEGLIDVEAKRRRLEFWCESLLGGPGVVIGDARLHLGGLGVARLTLGDVEIEHPNADFIFGDPGRAGDPGRSVGKALSVDQAVLRMPLDAALGLRSADLDVSLRRPWFRFAVNVFNESNLMGLWSSPSGEAWRTFPLGWPKAPRWRWRATDGVLEFTRARAGSALLTLVADFAGDGYFDPDTGRVDCRAGESALTVSMGGSYWRGRWSVDELSARASPDLGRGVAWRTERLRLRLSHFPLAAAALFVDDWPAKALPVHATVNGILAHDADEGGWRLSGQFFGAGLEGADGLGFTPGADWELLWRPGGDGGWRLTGHSDGGAAGGDAFWSLRRSADAAAPLFFRFHGPEDLTGRVRTALAAPPSPAAGPAGRLSGYFYGWPDWWRAFEAPAERPAAAAAMPDILAWLRDMGAVWEEGETP